MSVLAAHTDSYDRPMNVDSDQIRDGPSVRPGQVCAHASGWYESVTSLHTFHPTQHVHQHNK